MKCKFNFFTKMMLILKIKQKGNVKSCDVNDKKRMSFNAKSQNVSNPRQQAVMIQYNARYDVKNSSTRNFLFFKST